MITIRKKDDRGFTKTAWLESWHTFSFGHYHDENNMGFGPLRVINEDYVSPASGFPTHGHKNMEIITYVLSGVLSHKDSLRTQSAIRPGEVQVMSAGKGIMHSEINDSATDPVHLLQIWIMPQETTTTPEYRQKAFPLLEMKNGFCLLASPDGRDGSLTIRQDALVFAGKAEKGKTLRFPVKEGRLYWLQTARGGLELQGQSLVAGDGLAIENEQGTINVTAQSDAEVLLFDLPR